MSANTRLDWAGLLRSRRAPVSIWLVFSIVALVAATSFGPGPMGPDDHIRMLQVHDLLAGQSWWDVTQYRMNPPEGGLMHWSRLVDIPIAGAALVFGLLLPSAAAEHAAMLTVPLFYLLGTLLILQTILLRLSVPPLALAFTMVLLPLYPLLPALFYPGAVDHHTPQAFLALCCAALLLSNSRIAAAASGVLAAAWVLISLEGLPLVAALAGLYGLRYWLKGERLLQPFLTALAIAVPVVGLLTRPVSSFSLPFCDVIMPGHMLALGAAALIAAAIPFAPQQNTPRGRLVALAAIPLIVLPITFAALGKCASDPFTGLDQVLKYYWYSRVLEGMPIWKQPPSVIVMLIWPVLLLVSGWLAAKRMSMPSGDFYTLSLLALFALAATAYSFFLLRAAVVGQLLTIPFGAILLAEILPRARAIKGSLLRILATLACFGVATPAFATGAAKSLDAMHWSQQSLPQTLAPSSGAPCDIARLAQLPQSVLFTTFDAGPEILGKTDHSIVMAGYHRNVGPMRDVILAFTGKPDAAEAIVRAHHADYVLTCANAFDLALYRTDDPNNFANVLLKGKQPDWLEPVSGFDSGSLRVYRVKSAQ